MGFLLSFRECFVFSYNSIETTYTISIKILILFTLLNSVVTIQSFSYLAWQQCWLKLITLTCFWKIPFPLFYWYFSFPHWFTLNFCGIQTLGLLWLFDSHSNVTSTCSNSVLAVKLFNSWLSVCNIDHSPELQKCGIPFAYFITLGFCFVPCLAEIWETY